MKRCFSKNTVAALVLIAVYAALVILAAAFSFAGIADVLATASKLIPAALIVCGLCLSDKSRSFQTVMLCVAFGMIACTNVYTVAMTLISTHLNVLLTDGVWPLYAFSLVLLLCNIACFVGSLLLGKTRIVLQIGCLGYAVTALAMQIYEFVVIGGFGYLQSVPEGMSPINGIVLLKLCSLILFYLGVFVSTTRKST